MNREQIEANLRAAGVILTTDDDPGTEEDNILRVPTMEEMEQLDSDMDGVDDDDEDMDEDEFEENQ